MKNYQNTKQAFSIVEVMTAVALFSIVLTVALGSLITVIDANNRSKGIKLVVNNLNLAMEAMSRDLRVGVDYCDNGSGSNCDSSTGVDTIYFTNDQGLDMIYTLVGGAIMRNINSSGNQQITGSDVVIDDLDFYIRNTAVADDLQPSVTVVLNGHVGVSDRQTVFSIQTTISQRKFAP